VRPRHQKLRSHRSVNAGADHLGQPGQLRFRLRMTDAIADQEHTAMAAEVIAKHANSAHQEQLVREAAAHMVRFKIAKFQGIYNAYA